MAALHMSYHMGTVRHYLYLGYWGVDNRSHADEKDDMKTAGRDALLSREQP